MSVCSTVHTYRFAVHFAEVSHIGREEKAMTIVMNARKSHKTCVNGLLVLRIYLFSTQVQTEYYKYYG